MENMPPNQKIHIDFPLANGTLKELGYFCFMLESLPFDLFGCFFFILRYTIRKNQEPGRVPLVENPWHRWCHKRMPSFDAKQKHAR